MTRSWFTGGLPICVLVMCACSSSNSSSPAAGGSAGGAGGGGAGGMTMTANCPDGLLSEGPSTGQSPQVASPAAASCSALSVDVIVAGATGRDPQKMQQVYNVLVTAEGATSGAESFFLPGFPHAAGYVYQTASAGQIVLAEFVYGTAAQSGRVSFRIQLADGSLKTLASGVGDGTIQLGSTVKMSVTVDPVDSW